ncbi:MarR family winged helix-turn-helix transcriptional regulator [Curtobacterium sp. VKM Ac-2887]|uniref:MarR family winged helix-turn-helix transcriptional regulator n=1 Tax=Curtobacterium sp. VKM Ac-2887 TaxID=2783819 RepID=UPI00188C754A|nr:MarR family transcriptional regulator [Curtobacterium sp. VKM Ac-2887]MBF4588289.1 MarR family transcriptional regulator [Curtobacterium sp. VKM Ac-2887]
MNAPKPHRDEAFVLMRQIIREHSRVGEDWIRARDINLEQGYILGYLVDHPGAIQRDVARAMHRGEANASSMLQKLERRGLVERRIEPGNGRSKRVFATPEGAALITGLDAAMADVDQQILAPLTGTHRAALNEILHTIAAHLDRSTTETS